MSPKVSLLATARRPMIHHEIKCRHRYRRRRRRQWPTGTGVATMYVAGNRLGSLSLPCINFFSRVAGPVISRTFRLSDSPIPPLPLQAHPLLGTA